MRTICLQGQPNRAPGIGVNAVSMLMPRLSLPPEIRGVSIQRGPRHLLVSFLFTSQAVRRAWRMVHLHELAHRKRGPRLRRSSIVTCEGSRGWDNYLLLNRIDAQQALDSLT